jgi:hypothetical protein
VGSVAQKCKSGAEMKNRSINAYIPPSPLCRCSACHRTGRHNVCNYSGIFAEPCPGCRPRRGHLRRQWGGLLHSRSIRCWRLSTEPCWFCLNIRLSVPDRRRAGIAGSMTTMGVQCVLSSRFPCSKRRTRDRTWPDQDWAHSYSEPILAASILLLLSSAFLSSVCLVVREPG